MAHFFARLYEWFGLIPFYSGDMAEFLKGMDVACTGYYALPWYFHVGILMVAVTFLVFSLQYDLVSIERFPKQQHWELSAVIIAAFNFASAFTVPFVAHLTRYFCPSLHITLLDCAGFGISNAIWAVILFSLLSLLQKARMQFIK